MLADHLLDFIDGWESTLNRDAIDDGKPRIRCWRVWLSRHRLGLDCFNDDARSGGGRHKRRQLSRLRLDRSMKPLAALDRFDLRRGQVTDVDVHATLSTLNSPV